MPTFVRFVSGKHFSGILWRIEMSPEEGGRSGGPNLLPAFVSLPLPPLYLKYRSISLEMWETHEKRRQLQERRKWGRERSY